MSVCCLPAAGPRVMPIPCLPSEAVLQERQPQQQHHQQLRAQQQQQPELRRRQQRQQHLQQEQLRLHARHGGGPHGGHGHPQPVHALPRDAAEPVHQAAGPVRGAGTPGRAGGRGSAHPCGPPASRTAARAGGARSVMRAAAVSRRLCSVAAAAHGPGPRSSGLQIKVSRWTLFFKTQGHLRKRRRFKCPPGEWEPKEATCVSLSTGGRRTAGLAPRQAPNRSPGPGTRNVKIRLPQGPLGHTVTARRHELENISGAKTKRSVCSGSGSISLIFLPVDSAHTEAAAESCPARPQGGRRCRR